MVPIATGPATAVVFDSPNIEKFSAVISFALAHKLAAWNERRLIRDLYDAYFLITRTGVDPDPDTLKERLRNMQSRRPELKRVTSMTIDDFKEALLREVSDLTDRDIDEELAGLLSPTDRAGLSIRIRVALVGLLETLGQQRT